MNDERRAMQQVCTCRHGEERPCVKCCRDAGICPDCGLKRCDCALEAARDRAIDNAIDEMRENGGRTRRSFRRWNRF